MTLMAEKVLPGVLIARGRWCPVELAALCQ